MAELNPTGSALVYSTFLGGGGDGAGIAVDGSGNAYITGYANAADFPSTPGVLQATCNIGGSCGFITKINPTGSALIYSTFLGNSIGTGIALDGSGDAYVTGRTGSSGFPITAGAFQTTCSSGNSCAFVSELNPTGSALIYSTYLGGGTYDRGNGIAVDDASNAYVTGSTNSTNFPTTPGAFQNTCGAGCSNGTAFVTKLNPTGTALAYSTYLGGSNYDYGSGIAVDSSGNAYVTGATQSADFPVTPGAFQMTFPACIGGCYEAFVAELNPLGSDLVYSTYLGDGVAGGSAIAVDSSGNTYVTGSNPSSGFPTTPGALQTTGGGSNDAFVVKFVPGDQVWPLSLTFGNQTIGVASTSQNFVLTNSGTTTLTITSISVTGTDSGDFSQTNDCGTSRQVGSSCTIAVTFTPTTTGTRLASVTIIDNAPNNPQTVALSGTGSQSVVTLSPPSLTFGPQPVSTTSPPESIILVSNGTLDISSVTTSAQFAQTNNCGNTLPAGGSCRIDVTFTPTASGLQNGTLTLIDSAIDSPQTLSLSGVGTQSAVTLFPKSLDFGNQPVTIKSQQISTLTNTGTGTLTIASMSIKGSNSGDFAEINNCGTSVPVGGSCNIIVTFTPSSTGTRTAALSITDNAPDSPRTLPLTGVGSSTPSFSLGASPTNASVNPGGSATYSISAVQLNGFSSAISLSCSVSGVGASVPACSLSPASITDTLSTLTVSTTAGIPVGTITVTGTSGAGNLTASIPVTLTVISAAAPGFSLVASPASVSVHPGNSAAYTVSLTPYNGFNNLVSLTCSVPSNDKLGCSFNPTSINPKTTSTLTVTTTPPTVAAVTPKQDKFLPLYAIWLPIPGMALAGLGLGARRRNFGVGVILILTVALALLLAGCGGGGSSTPSGGGGGTPGTPLGSYSVVVTATSGSLTQTTNVTLTVR